MHQIFQPNFNVIRRSLPIYITIHVSERSYRTTHDQGRTIELDCITQIIKFSGQDRRSLVA